MEYIKVPLKNILHISRIVTLYYFDFAPDFQNEGETHDFWEIVYVDSGEVNLTGGEQVFHVKQGEMMFHRPNEFHRVEGDGAHASSVFIITFDCASPAMRFFHGKVMSVPHEFDSLLRNLIDECTSSFILSRYPLTQKKNAPLGGQQLIRNYLECFLICMMRTEARKKDDTAHSLLFTSQDNLEEKLTRDIKEYLKARLHTKVTLKEIGAHFHFSVTTLCTAFRKNTGESIIHYFLSVKIKEACKMLSEQSDTIAVVAERLGFDNSLYFSRMFRKYTGLSPTEYRRKKIKSANKFC